MREKRQAVIDDIVRKLKEIEEDFEDKVLFELTAHKFAELSDLFIRAYHLNVPDDRIDELEDEYRKILDKYLR